MFPSFRDSGPFLNLTGFPGGGSNIPVPVVSVAFVWTDNGDGTASVAGSTDISTYSGIDYGTTMGGPYTSSAFDYSTYPTLELGTAHTIPVPDEGTGGTLADGTYYYRVWAGTPAGFSNYITPEQTGTISSFTASQVMAPGIGYIDQEDTNNYMVPGGGYVQQVSI